MTFRVARPGEDVALTDLSLRSVQETWNYSDEFMAWEPEAITVSPKHIESGMTYVLEENGRMLGFYVLTVKERDIELSRLMVDSASTGNGFGRTLWDHAVQTARERGYRKLTLDADPNAEAFYLRMGAETLGDHDWEPPMMPGWRVKKMRFDL